jgi:hypothetical protein
MLTDVATPPRTGDWRDQDGEDLQHIAILLKRGRRRTGDQTATSSIVNEISTGSCMWKFDVSLR